MAFRSLRAGWKLGKGLPVADAAYQTAVHLNSLIPQHESKDVFPNEDGGIEVAIYKEATRFGFRIFPDGSIALTEENGENSEESGKLTLVDAGHKILSIASRWNTPSSFIFQTTSPNYGDFAVPAFNPHQTRAGFQSSNSIARTQSQGTFAYTDATSMEAHTKLPPSHRYTSPLTQKSISQAA